jgi:hypothetical protein
MSEREVQMNSSDLERELETALKGVSDANIDDPEHWAEVLRTKLADGYGRSCSIEDVVLEDTVRSACASFGRDHVTVTFIKEDGEWKREEARGFGIAAPRAKVSGET